MEIRYYKGFLRKQSRDIVVSGSAGSRRWWYGTVSNSQQSTGIRELEMRDSQQVREQQRGVGKRTIGREVDKRLNYQGKRSVAKLESESEVMTRRRQAGDDCFNLDG